MSRWPSIEDRLAARTVVSINGCHEWTGPLTERQYGKTWYQGRQRMVHRVVWELTRGPIPTGWVVLHGCDNPHCCNPAHLFLGTAADQRAAAGAKGRAHQPHTPKTECPRGHPFSPRNTYVNPRGARVCRTCKRVNRKKSA